MKLGELRTLYSKGEISKAAFIDEMHNLHMLLFDYATFLKESDISKITIEDDQLIITSRKTNYNKGGISFYCDIVDKRIAPIETFNFGTYESVDSDMLYRIIEKDYTVFDIGGNIGWYANHIASLLEDGKIYAFEPIPETHQKLLNNVKLNGYKNIVVENFAFSDKQDKITFFYSPAIPGAASSKNITENTNMQQLECFTDTVDNYTSTNNIKKIDFIKCDVEGAEFMVFKGAKNTIAAHHPIVFSEMLRKWSAKFNYHPNDIINFFRELGYNCYIANDKGLVLFSEVDENTTQTNFFFLHSVTHKEKITQILSH
ncbi:FkbM family methyltransferase [Mucilaginibacter sp.]|uniref:FkbM family methyltransferase n=1 Tax=Mucilaginibacter sp. TaxID=1882438 RepID=UPI00261A7243|nr:FkbM family methyltransferase [Mucilaginibacter sp.]MDB4926300.1 FkbM family methyltransferase [Mucilaginibacter sp.]